MEPSTNIDHTKGFSLMEVMLAIALFAIVAIIVFSSILYGQRSTKNFAERSQAILLADEGVNAVRNIRDANFTSFFSVADGNYGIGVTANKWVLSGAFDLVGDFKRQVALSTINSTTRLLTSTVSWPQASPLYSTDTKTYFTNWANVIATSVIGILVYANGGVTTDSMQYQTFDSTGAWSVAASLADVDGLTTNKRPRVIRVYDSPTRNEKIAISRHYNGTAQFIYGQVFNGTTWGNVQLLSTWTATTFLDVQNFGGTYLSNGTFVSVFSDNTIIPKMRTWDGSIWSAQTSLTTLGTSQIPTYIVTKNRSSTNEIMAAFYTQGSDTITQYYSGTVWSAITSHATTAPANSRNLMDFEWSLNDATRGMIVYTSSTTDTTIDGKIWTANGTGGGVWGTAVQSATVTGTIGTLILSPRVGANEFHACRKGAATPFAINCYKATFSAGVLTWTTPSNTAIATTSITGNQITVGIGFESTSGDPALALYSDNTAIPKYKKYAPTTNTWDASAMSLSTLVGALNTSRVIPRSGSNDMMVLMGNANLDNFTILWDGTNNQMYSTPAGRALTTHGTNGSAITDYWFDFVWDN